MPDPQPAGQTPAATRLSKTRYPARLITLDVGGTLGTTTGPTLFEVLTDLSPRPAAVVAALLDRLQITPHWRRYHIQRWCDELDIPPKKWPHRVLAAPFTIYPEAPNAVRRLSACATVVTLSNSIAPLAHHHAEVARACPGLAALHLSYVLEHAKPDPAVFCLVAARHGATPAEMIHVGDTWRDDVLGALGAGAPARCGSPTADPSPTPAWSRRAALSWPTASAMPQTCSPGP